MRLLKKSLIGKKGITPLIATVLLIGFTVALAAVVITWGSGFTENITKGTEERTEKAIACTSDVNFALLNVKCITKKITIENKGDIDIKGFTLRFFNAGGENTGVTNFDDVGAANPTLKKFNVREITLENIIPVGTNKVEALATVVLNGQNVTCGDSPESIVFTPAC